MGLNTEIEWADHTANLWIGCSKVHSGCDNCYAEKMNHRFGYDNWGNNSPRRTVETVWRELDKMQRNAEKNQTAHTVFVGSMMDIFEKPMPLIDKSGADVEDISTADIRNKFFNDITYGKYPNLIFLLLTKRPGNINKYIPEQWRLNGPPKNVMFGTSVSDQKSANDLIPKLAAVEGYKFLSIEPLLGEIDITKKTINYTSTWQPLSFIEVVDWVIVGGESGFGARPMDPKWVISLQEQCAESGVPFFFKQWGEWHPMGQVLADGTMNCLDKGEINNLQSMRPATKVGKKAAGSYLNGKEIKQLPACISGFRFSGYYQKLFNHMCDEHNLILLDSEMDEIIRIVREIEMAKK